MKPISLVLTFAMIALFGIACTEAVTPTNTSTPSRSAATPAPSADPFAAAQANYQKHCEACHGPSGEGGLVKVEDKQIKVASLKSDHAKKQRDDALMKIITSGEEEMPAFHDKLSRDEINELVRYVRHHFQGAVSQSQLRAPSATSENAEMRREDFRLGHHTSRGRASHD